jgi:MarR family 2-MHQ and catechol resistance regulon transcriptional repressor
LEIYQKIKSVYLHLDDGDQQFLQEYGLTLAQYYALVWLGESSKKVTQLSDDLLCDPSNITRIANTLERKGLITRKRSQQDRRVVHLTRTKKGTELCQEVQTNHEAYTRERLNFLSAEETALLSALLDKMDEHLNKQLHDELITAAS